MQIPLLEILRIVSSDCFDASSAELSEASACVLSGGSREKVRRPTISLVVLLRLYSTLRIAQNPFDFVEYCNVLS